MKSAEKIQRAGLIGSAADYERLFIRSAAVLVASLGREGSMQRMVRVQGGSVLVRLDPPKGRKG